MARGSYGWVYKPLVIGAGETQYSHRVLKEAQFEDLDDEARVRTITEIRLLSMCSENIVGLVPLEIEYDRAEGTLLFYMEEVEMLCRRHISRELSSCVALCS